MKNILNKLLSKENNSKDYLYIRDIVDNFLENPKVEKLIFPNNSEYFLVNKEKKISISIGEGKVMIANHKYLFKKDLKFSLTDNLKSKILKSINKDRQELKKELFENEIDLLINIFKESNN